MLTKIIILFIAILFYMSIQMILRDSKIKGIGKSKIGCGFKYILPALVIAVFLYSCSEVKPAKTDAPKVYNVLTLQEHLATTYNDFPATIQGQEVIEIRPKVDGYLKAIYVTEGATVKKNQLLFKINNPLYEQAVVTANAAIKIAIADVNTAKMNVEKVRPLVDKDIVSKYELESARFTLQSKEAALAQANATLVNAKINVGYTTLRSPESGIIGSIPYKIGALVSSTTASPLTILSNIANVYAYFSMNEKDLLSISGNMGGKTLEYKLNHMPPATLLLADGSEYAQKGKIETASGLINTQTGTASFKAIFPNPQGIIRSGASATVRMTSTLESTLLVPQSATYEIQDKRFVYALTAENRVISKAIVSQSTNDGQFFIVQSGLRKGDRILVNNYNLKDSTLIIPKSINADSLYSQVQKVN